MNLPFLYESFHRSSLIPVLCSTLLYVDKLSTVGGACAQSLSLSLWEARGFPRVLLLPMRNHGREVEKHGKDRYPGPAVKPKLRDAMVGVSPRNSPSHPYATRSQHSRRSKDATTWRPPRQTLTRATSGCSHADSYGGKGAESSVEDCPAGRLAFVPKAFQKRPEWKLARYHLTFSSVLLNHLAASDP